MLVKLVRYSECQSFVCCVRGQVYTYEDKRINSQPCYRNDYVDSH
jgi:hypothetical protein